MKTRMRLKEYMGGETPDLSAVPAAPPGFDKLISALFGARDIAHDLHLRTASYAEHVALKELYEQLADHADKLAEGWQGKHGKLPQVLPNASLFAGAPTAIEYVNLLASFLEGEGKALVGADDHLKNLYDELLTDVYSAKYKLECLK